MEASALRAPALARRPLTAPLLRLRSDEQLVALFRAGSDDAFAAIHDRYRQRLFAYVRQMLAGASRADAEDVLQDVFVRAYGALRRDDRGIALRAWLYRVAHNRCIDQVRQPAPAAADLLDCARGPLQDPIELAQRRDDLRRLVADLGRLPEQQRSALLLREIDGLAYTDIAAVLDVTTAAVKSLLVRARIGLVEAIEAREADCTAIRADLLDTHDRGVKPSGRARRHMRDCAGCREYRTALRGMRRSFAALSPMAGFGPLALAAKALGAGGAAAGSGGTAAGTATVCKVAAVVCTAALATGTAVELDRHRGPAPERDRATGPAAPTRTDAGAAAPATPAASHASAARRPAPAAPAAPLRGAGRAAPGAAAPSAAVVDVAPGQRAPAAARPAPEPAEPVTRTTGGSAAPQAEIVMEPPPIVTAAPAPAMPAEPTPDGPAATVAPPLGGPPPEH